MRWLTFLTRGEGGAVERVAVLLCALHCGAAFDELPRSHGEPVLLRGLRVRGKARPPPPLATTTTITATSHHLADARPHAL